MLAPKMRPKTTDKHHKIASKTHLVKQIGISEKIAPRLHEALIFEGPGSPKHSQNPPKTLPKATPRGTKISIDFCIAFLSFLAPFWPPTWGHFGAQDGFKIEKMGSKNSGVAHPERFEMRPCLSTPSWAVLAPFWPPTWCYFGPSWLRFGPSWLRFGPSWLCLGSVLASDVQT